MSGTTKSYMKEDECQKVDTLGPQRKTYEACGSIRTLDPKDLNKVLQEICRKYPKVYSIEMRSSNEIVWRFRCSKKDLLNRKVI